MEATTFAQVAGMVAGFGAIGVAIAALNIVALRVVRVDEVPSCVRGRILWWGAHNSAFLLISAVLAVAGLGALAAA
jgi:hypothetical protein